MGAHLRRRFGTRLLTIGNAIRSGEIDPEGVRLRLAAPSAGSLEELLSQVRRSRFWLDLRSAPDPVNRWLDQKWTLGHGAETMQLSVHQAFDVLFYLDAVTPAHAG